jgi:hypothetical protein
MMTTGASYSALITLPSSTCRGCCVHTSLFDWRSGLLRPLFLLAAGAKPPILGDFEQKGGSEVPQNWGI